MTITVWVNYRCKDCGHTFDGHELLSFNSTTPPDKNWDFGEACEVCKSSSIEKSGLDSDIPF